MRLVPQDPDWVGCRTLAAADEIHDFDLVARPDLGRIEADPLDDLKIVFDGHSTGIDVQRGQQL